MIFEPIDQVFENVGEVLHIPADQIRLVFCLVISFPIGLFFKFLKGRVIRHIASIALGVFFQILIFRSEVIYPVVLALFGYFAPLLLGRGSARLVFVVSLLYLSIFHIWRMWVDWGGYRIEITGVLMIYVCKCTALAWNYKDGGAKDPSKLSAEQQRRKVVKFPSLLEYLSYMYFYGNTLVGPACEYIDHVQFINLEGDYAKVNEVSTAFGGLGYLLSGFANMGIVVVVGKYFTIEQMASPEFAEKSYLVKFLLLTFALQVHRCRYYTAWLLGTANVTSAGLNYNPSGKDHFQRFGKIVGVRPLDMETYDNVKDKLEAWNTPCQLWLKNYVYARIVSEEEARKSPGKATFASNCTFMVSAFWHGFYPGYYLAFIWMFLAQQIAKTLFKIRAKLRWIPEPIGFVLRWTLSRFSIDWMGTTFVLLELGKALNVYKAFFFIPNAILIFGFLFLNYSGIAKTPRAPKSTSTEASPNKSPAEAEPKKGK